MLPIHHASKAPDQWSAFEQVNNYAGKVKSFVCKHPVQAVLLTTAALAITGGAISVGVMLSMAGGVAVGARNITPTTHKPLLTKAQSGTPFGSQPYESTKPADHDSLINPTKEQVAARRCTQSQCTCLTPATEHLAGFGCYIVPGSCNENCSPSWPTWDHVSRYCPIHEETACSQNNTDGAQYCSFSLPVVPYECASTRRT